MDREKFLARQKNEDGTVRTVPVTLADGSAVECRKLSQSEVEKIGRDYSNARTVIAGMRFIVCRCVLDSDGNPMFTDRDADLVREQVDFDDLTTISREVMKFSGMLDAEGNPKGLSKNG